MESIEGALNEGLEPSKSPESQMAAHQVREKGYIEVQRYWGSCDCDRERQRRTECTTVKNIQSFSTC